MIHAEGGVHEMLVPALRPEVPSRDAEATNYGGRFAFFIALEKEWPELLQSLITECLPSFPSDISKPRSLKDLLVGPGEACAHLLKSWAERHRLQDEWMLDAAVQTLAYARTQEPPSPRWVYIAYDLPLQMFQKKLEGLWIPGVVSWEDFRREIMRQLSESLESYAKQAGYLWAEGKRSLDMHAVWTIWRFQGRSAEQTRLKNSSRGFPEVSRVNIQTEVRNFARSIGLTLP